MFQILKGNLPCSAPRDNPANPARANCGNGAKTISITFQRSHQPLLRKKVCTAAPPTNARYRQIKVRELQR